MFNYQNVFSPGALDAHRPVEDIGYKFLNAAEQPCSLHGFWTTDPYIRLPEKATKEANVNAQKYGSATSGGRVRFATDSHVICLRVTDSNYDMHYLSQINMNGFDIYVKNGLKDVYAGTFKPPFHPEPLWQSWIRFPDRQKREITINFPLYGTVGKLEIGLEKDAQVWKHCHYKYEQPVLFYGSSITQGGCASRPGMSYPLQISRKLDCDIINLGLAGGCLGEQGILDHMASMNISAFICDYDHNAPSAEYLQQTHYNVYRTIRNAKPDIPILLISMPGVYLQDPELAERRRIIMRTYLKGVSEGDNNLWYIDGYSLFAGDNREECTVDRIHPNDFGFMRMADVIGKTLETAFLLSKNQQAKRRRDLS